MEQIARPFLNFMRISPTHRSSLAQTRALIGQLLCKLEGFSVDSERDPQRERAAAENLVKCLYHERMMLCELEAREYVKIVRLLWEFEDQGYIVPSSFINDLGIRTLLETCQDNKCKPIVISSLQHMFITATKQNKRVLAHCTMAVDAVLHSIGGHNAGHTNMLDVWEHAIVASIGKSSMRMEVVESSLLEKCTNNHLICSSTKNSLLQCIASVSSSVLFDWKKVHAAVIEKIHISDEKTAVAYVRFFHALASMPNIDPIHCINDFISFLRTTKSPQIDLQCAIYNAIDDLKKKTKTNVYQEPFFRIFSGKWETK